jgi:hypothetical protein
MLSSSLSLIGCAMGLEGLYLNTAGNHPRVHSRAILRLLARMMEYKGETGRQLHNSILSLMDSPTHYGTPLFNKNHKALLKPQILMQLRAELVSSVQNVLRAFQSDISWTSIWSSISHHSNVAIVSKVSGTAKTSLAIVHLSTQRPRKGLRCYFVPFQDASSPLRRAVARQEETIWTGTFGHNTENCLSQVNKYCRV